jgi:hypothetical protein
MLAGQVVNRERVFNAFFFVIEGRKRRRKSEVSFFDESLYHDDFPLSDDPYD